MDKLSTEYDFETVSIRITQLTKMNFFQRLENKTMLGSGISEPLIKCFLRYCQTTLTFRRHTIIKKVYGIYINTLYIILQQKIIFTTRKNQIAFNITK